MGFSHSITILSHSYCFLLYFHVFLASETFSSTKFSHSMHIFNIFSVFICGYFVFDSQFSPIFFAVAFNVRVCVCKMVTSGAKERRCKYTELTTKKKRKRGERASRASRLARARGKERERTFASSERASVRECGSKSKRYYSLICKIRTPKQIRKEKYNTN